MIDDASTASSSAASGSKPKQYRCDICGESFDGIDILDSHKRLDHSDSGRSEPAGVG